ncbi:hypothetical protein [Phascolarctobacterium faecium]|uniref:hypothetical protein n=1 Tax=Phascolarctobacterium faecium TaxID=33025 RepID=UPI001032D5AC|nr:hypothetical protein [Phascolarctobacterium faecium]
MWKFMYNLISKREIIGIALILLPIHAYFVYEAAQVNPRGVQAAGGLIFLNYFVSIIKTTLVYCIVKKICLILKEVIFGD